MEYVSPTLTPARLQIVRAPSTVILNVILHFPRNLWCSRSNSIQLNPNRQIIKTPSRECCQRKTCIWMGLFSGKRRMGKYTFTLFPFKNACWWVTCVWCHNSPELIHTWPTQPYFPITCFLMSRVFQFTSFWFKKFSKFHTGMQINIRAKKKKKTPVNKRAVQNINTLSWYLQSVLMYYHIFIHCWRYLLKFCLVVLFRFFFSLHLLREIGP